jgi:AcrR family transcriptional regulator
MEAATVRQKQIIAAALAIISENGLEALTMKRIASRVGFSDAAVYRHFRNKSFILSAMVDRFADGSVQELERINAANSSGSEQVRQFFIDRCRTFAVDRALAAVMFAEDLFKSDPALAARIHDTMQTHRRLLLRSIRLGQRQGTIADLPAAHLFTVIMGSLRLLVLQWQVSGFAFELPRAGEELWRSLETLIGGQRRKVS